MACFKALSCESGRLSMGIGRDTSPIGNGCTFAKVDLVFSMKMKCRTGLLVVFAWLKAADYFII